MNPEHTDIPPCSVLILLDSLDYTSAPRLAVELAGALDARHFDVRLLVLGGPAHLAPLAAAQGTAVDWLAGNGTAGVASLPRLVATLRRELPDVLFCLGVRANILGRVAGRLAGAPAVVGSLRRPGDGWRQLEPLLGALAHRVVVPAASLVHNLPPWIRGRCVHLFEGVDGDVFAPARANLRENAPRIVCLGRLERDRGQEHLLHAFALVLARQAEVEGPPPRLLVVGDGPRRERLVSLARHLDIVGGVEFLPARQDVAPLYHVARFVVAPGMRLGAPAVVLEAMASGLPVVASDVGGLRELVTHEETGLLTPAGGVEPLARAMGLLLEDEALCRRMGEAGRRRALEFGGRKGRLRAMGDFFTELAAKA